jgi:hypothetical protein
MYLRNEISACDLPEWTIKTHYPREVKDAWNQHSGKYIEKIYFISKNIQLKCLQKVDWIENVLFHQFCNPLSGRCPSPLMAPSKITQWVPIYLAIFLFLSTVNIKIPFPKLKQLHYWYHLEALHNLPPLHWTHYV